MRFFMLVMAFVQYARPFCFTHPDGVEKGTRSTGAPLRMSQTRTLEAKFFSVRSYMSERRRLDFS